MILRSFEGRKTRVLGAIFDASVGWISTSNDAGVFSVGVGVRAVSVWKLEMAPAAIAMIILLATSCADVQSPFDVLLLANPGSQHIRHRQEALLYHRFM